MITLEPSIITGDDQTPDLLLIDKKNNMYVLELTIGFEPNIEKNAKQKNAKHKELLKSMEKDYTSVTFNRVNWKAIETMFLESIDLYAKNWSKREQEDLKYLSEWKDHLKELITDRISDLKGHFKSPKCKVLDQPDVKDTLYKLHANYVLVPADKAANNVIIVCKKYYIDTLVKELE